MLQTGSFISHYRITGSLGAGGMGEVYLAEDIKLDRTVALKLLPSDVAEKAERRQRFITEAKAASALNHPNVCVIHEIGEDEDDRLFIAMEYVVGVTLDEKLKQAPLDTETIIDIGIQVADALDAAYASGIVHRDVKPSNIGFGDRGEVKVLDFGLAKRLAAKGVHDATTQYQTLEGNVMGTPSYMSPEQALGKSVDHRTDIFSLGIVLYELASGRPAFKGDSFAETLDLIVHVQPDALARFNYDLPPELERIILKCLEKDRENRFQTPKELLVDLRNLKRIVATTGSQNARSAPGTPKSQPKASARWVIPAGVAVTLAAAAVLIWKTVDRPKDPTSAIVPQTPPAGRLDPFRFAVLPLDNISQEPSDAYFTEGMTAELIATLSKMRGLTVIGRTSVMQYKETDKSIAEIGKELRVGTLLEGTVRKAGQRLRITLQMIDVESQGPIWSEDYDRELKDVFAIQREIAHQVADALKVQLRVGEAARLAAHPTDNLEAYQEYLKGRFYWSKRAAADLEKAIGFFDAAISLDGEFALAYAGLASCHALYPLYSRRPALEHVKKATEAAVTARKLDDSVAEAHAVEGYIKTFFEYDSKGADQAFQRAIARDPNHPTTHHWYSLFLSKLDRREDALSEIELANQLDPSSLIISHTVALTHFFQKDYAKAEDVCLKTIELARAFRTDFFVARWTLGRTYVVTGRTPQAIKELEKVRSLLPGVGYYPGELGRAYAVAGDASRAREILRELEAYALEGFSVAYDIALVHKSLGNYEKAIASLRKALEERDWMISALNVEPGWEALHSDPEFLRLTRAIGLE